MFKVVTGWHKNPETGHGPKQREVKSKFKKKNKKKTQQQYEDPTRIYNNRDPLEHSERQAH